MGSVSSLVQSGVMHAGYGIAHRANVRDREYLGNFESITGWTALSNDTTGIATDLSHILGTVSLEFDKVDGTDDKVYAGIAQTITAVDCSRFIATDYVSSAVYIADKTNVTYAFVRLGTSVSHYNEWRLLAASITQATWQAFDMTLGSTEVTVVGNGWNPAAITYICVGAVFAAEANALADLRFDHCMIRSAN